MKKQGYVIVATLDDMGRIHCSAKGIVGLEAEGRIYLIDLYKARTYKNLANNPIVSLTFVNEHQFAGYTLQGKAKIVEREDIADHIIEEWEEKVIQRISQRLIKNLQEGKQVAAHPEAAFPHPKYLIEVDVENIIDLAPSIKK
jgi:uncharacterized pyridoxamine 5'-phosphate oxidase family protein